MGIKSWIFLKGDKPAFKQLSPSQNGWIRNIDAVQHVWRTLRSAGFDYLETGSLNQDPLGNTFGVIRLHCGSDNNPTVGQFVDALKTSIINGLVKLNPGLPWQKLHLTRRIFLPGNWT